ncbi:MAG: hypothetical protein SAJ72_24165 [Jaaginema sp. PMC 1080.18]|nr:hypothetical protein [Jaaginema sp. PMC 1080.18]MEC4869032.1 hypothetical protein [Jaaginema sp. PMC 1078.18]
MYRLVEIACDRACTHIAWTADRRNLSGMQFYQKLGATVVQTQGNCCFWQWHL